MCIEIFGYKHPTTKQFAVDLGIALQMTNILRDIGKDAKNGRIYLPQEDLIKFNYSEQEILSLVYNDNFKDLMIYESGRAKQYFNSATANLDLDDKNYVCCTRNATHLL